MLDLEGAKRRVEEMRVVAAGSRGPLLSAGDVVALVLQVQAETLEWALHKCWPNESGIRRLIEIELMDTRAALRLVVGEE